MGITGTDGKTTTAYLVRSILGQAGLPAGLVSTVDVVIGGHAVGNPARTTTPEAPVLQAHLAAMVEAGDRFAVLETSSHGLAQDRVGAVAYDVAVLTNLTHEHLEFHGTLAAYAAAKRRLFEALAGGPQNPAKGWPKTGVVNLDDPAAADFAAAAQAAGATVITYGFDEAADVRGVALRESLQRLELELVTPRWRGHLALSLAGRFNAWNALAAAAVGEALALPPEAVGRASKPWPASPAAWSASTGAAVRRPRRLCPHARGAGQGPGRAGAARRRRRRPAHRRLRLGRRA